MSDTSHIEHTLEADGGHRIHLNEWRPDGETRQVLLICHGLGEHAGRYARFAAEAVKHGITVYAHDHRGHGEAHATRGFFADRNGWRLVVDDVLTVCAHARDAHPEAPIAMLGHSMGSYIAQSFALHYGDRLSGLILSASTWPSRLSVIPGMLIARLEAWRLGSRGNSALLDKLGFESFNKRFEPARTKHDWLSRDEAEVDKYENDPLCGGPYTAGLWVDLLGALFELSSDSSILRIRSDIPILITGGQYDPVGGEDGMAKLMLHYAQTSHQRLKLKIYPEGRHEMLNETNRDEVSADMLEWLVNHARRR